VRLCIRQAIPQLLEYSYFPDKNEAKLLVIISENKMTKHTTAYIKNLRTRFKFPIYYQQIDLVKGTISKLY
jgi:hypothetical protein